MQSATTRSHDRNDVGRGGNRQRYDGGCRNQRCGLRDRKRNRRPALRGFVGVSFRCRRHAGFSSLRVSYPGLIPRARLCVRRVDLFNGCICNMHTSGSVACVPDRACGLHADRGRTMLLDAADRSREKARVRPTVPKRVRSSGRVCVALRLLSAVGGTHLRSI